MDLTIPAAARSELAAAFFLAAIVIGLAVLCAYLYRAYRKPYFGWLAVAWTLFALRLGAIVSFLLSGSRIWLYWHQVTTGWTALALLWAALVFSQQLRLRRAYLALVLFPPVWSFVAIYLLDNFLLAAGPAVVFLSLATLWTGWAFFRFHRQVGSPGAALLGVALFLWALHHLDYPFLRARGVWNPWGYYLDGFFVLATAAGILLLVLEDLRRGLATLSDLSGDLQQGETEGDVLGRLLGRPLTLPGVRGTAMYLLPEARWVRGAGLCEDWTGREPTGAPGAAVSRTIRSGHPEIVRDGDGGVSHTDAYAYAAALPVLRGTAVTGAMLIVGDARDPFAALDERFLLALGRQVGAALETVDLTKRLSMRTHELEHLAGRMVQQHEDERRRLSRELHDETAQVLSAVKLQLGVLRENADAQSAERLDQALSLMDEGIRGIRDLTNALRPSLLDDLGLLPALRALVARFNEQDAVATEFDAPAVLPPLTDEAEVALFRSLQEALSNVGRHAGASHASVRVASENGQIAVTVQDDGRGVEPSELERVHRGDTGGLAGMRERIAALGGRVSVRALSGANGGTIVEVRLPTTSGEDA